MYTHLESVTKKGFNIPSAKTPPQPYIVNNLFKLITLQSRNETTPAQYAPSRYTPGTSTTPPPKHLPHKMANHLTNGNTHLITVYSYYTNE